MQSPHERNCKIPLGSFFTFGRIPMTCQKEGVKHGFWESLVLIEVSRPLWDLLSLVHDAQIILQNEGSRMNSMTTLLAGREQPLTLTRDHLSWTWKAGRLIFLAWCSITQPSCCAAAPNWNAQYDNLISEHINYSDTYKCINYRASFTALEPHIFMWLCTCSLPYQCSRSW